MLFVAGLASDFDDVDLKEMFELYGEVSSARLITDRATGKSKGFGFVDMPNEAEAKETIVTLDGVSISRKKLSVKEAEAQQNRPSGGGGSYNGGRSNNSGGYSNNRNFNNNNSGGYNNDRPRAVRFGDNNVNRNNDNNVNRNNDNNRDNRTNDNNKDNRDSGNSGDSNDFNKR